MKFNRKLNMDLNMILNVASDVILHVGSELQYDYACVLNLKRNSGTEGHPEQTGHWKNF